jgi:hypothetical protein
MAETGNTRVRPAVAVSKSRTTPMRRIVSTCVACLLAVFAFCAYAVDIRGRVDGRNAYTPRPYPIAGVPVTLFVHQQPTGWRVLANSYTGPDGIYYFRGVPPGSYVLQVQGRNFPVTLSQSPFQDIPPLLIQR